MATSTTLSPDQVAARQAAQNGQFSAAMELFGRALAAAPGDPGLAHEAADVARQMGQPALIEQIFASACAANPDEPHLRSSYIEAVLNHQRPEEALKMAQEAIAARPDHSGFHALKGLILQTLGQKTEAIAAFWLAHETDPKNMHALFNLEPLESGDGQAKVLAALEQAWAERSDLPVMDQIALGYARGRALERVKQFDESFESYAFGAALKRKAVNFNEQDAAMLQDRHQQLFSKLRLDKQVVDNARGAELVFVVSLPRSGSTLIEQILSSHSQANGIGERDFMMRAFDQWMAKGQGNLEALFSAEALQNAGDHYISLAREAAGRDTNIIVDKTLGNYAYLGFIQCVFPGAKIIHAVRDPMDTALSCFTTLFYFGMEWTYDLKELGRSVRRYQKFMGFWQRVLRSLLHHARYEDLLANPEAEVRQLLEFCGLEWEAACLEFHKTERAVATASVNQVRQPLYQTAKGRAANFEAQLEPLARAMGRANDPDWYLS